jgi:hypothetical protein
MSRRTLTLTRWRGPSVAVFEGQRLFLPARILLVVAPMHGRTRSRRLGRLRQHALSKVCAAWFITLILLPFTAPFPTYQLDHSSNGFPYDAIPKEVKDKIGSDDELALPSGWSVVPVTLNIVFARPVLVFNQTSRYPPPDTVLRL